MHAIQGAIAESATLSKDKLAFNRERLAFEREEFKRNAKNDARFHGFIMDMGMMMNKFMEKM